MAELISVDLKGKGEIEDGASISFLRAEMNRSMATPFAHIRYAIEGKEQENGLRIDLDKRLILDKRDLVDRADDRTGTQAVLERAELAISDVLGTIAEIRDTLLDSADPHADPPGYSPGPESFVYQITRLFSDHFTSEEIARIFEFWPTFSTTAIDDIHSYHRPIAARESE